MTSLNVSVLIYEKNSVFTGGARGREARKRDVAESQDSRNPAGLSQTKEANQEETETLTKKVICTCINIVGFDCFTWCIN